jgi:hypothetical protein
MIGTARAAPSIGHFHNSAAMQSTVAANRSLETESAETLAAAGEEEKTSAGLVVENMRVWRPVD